MNSFCSVYPRYSAGSPAMVSFEIAKKVAEDEKRDYEFAMSGRMGEKAKQRAERLGLSGIVETLRETRKGRKPVWEVYDVIMGERYFVSVDDRRKSVDARRTANAR